MRIQRDRARGWECVPSILPPSHGPLSRPSRANPSLDPKAPSHLFLPCFPNFARERQIPGGNGFVFSFPHPHGALRLRASPSLGMGMSCWSREFRRTDPQNNQNPKFPSFSCAGICPIPNPLQEQFPSKTPHLQRYSEFPVFPGISHLSLRSSQRIPGASGAPEPLGGVFIPARSQFQRVNRKSSPEPEQFQPF